MPLSVSGQCPGLTELGPESLSSRRPQPTIAALGGTLPLLSVSPVSSPQAHHLQEAASAQLEQLHLEAKRQGEVLAREVQEKEALVRERAVLEVRLQAVERDRQDLSDQLLGLR